MLLHRAEPSLPQTISEEQSKAGASCGQPGSQGEQGETGAWLCAQLLLRGSQIRILRIRRPSWAGRAGWAEAGSVTQTHSLPARQALRNRKEVFPSP